MSKRFERRLDKALNEGIASMFSRKQVPTQAKPQVPAPKAKPGNFAEFLRQFESKPYNIPSAELEAVLRNPHDRAALDRISSRDRHAYNLIQRYITSGGKDTGEDEEAEWGRGYWN